VMHRLLQMTACMAARSPMRPARTSRYAPPRSMTTCATLRNQDRPADPDSENLCSNSSECASRHAPANPVEWCARSACRYRRPWNRVGLVAGARTIEPIESSRRSIREVARTRRGCTRA
jgi:hypothetical protein